MSYGMFIDTPTGQDLYPLEAAKTLLRDNRKPSGLFVDVRQQCGLSVRMRYVFTIANLYIVRWIGINEQMSDKFIGAQ